MNQAEMHYLNCQDTECEKFACVARRDYERQILRLQDEVQNLKFVPGHSECPKCKFYLVSQTLYMKSGTVGANRDPQQCSNGCGPMWRVAWKDHANSAVRSSNKAGIENVRLRKEVELLRLNCAKADVEMADAAIERERKEWEEIDKEILNGA